MDLLSILNKVKGPSQYIGLELNSFKDVNKFQKSKLKIVLAYPDFYDVGMGHLGLRILYNIINSHPFMIADRVYMPMQDMKELLKSNNFSLCSIEYKIPISEFDIVGFSLQYELTYTNILAMLELGKIPILSHNRAQNTPLIVAGGPCTLNPEPLKEIIDIFMIGEIEEVIIEFLEDIITFRQKKSKEEILYLLDEKYDWIYIPSIRRKKVKKIYIKDLNKTYIKRWLVPNRRIVHNRVAIEAMRGCPNKCRFCQARIYYRPLRFKKQENIMKEAIDLYKNTGYEEISIMGLSVGDYPSIENLLAKLIEEFSPKYVNISLPSLRINRLINTFPKMLNKIRKSTITLAPEAGTPRLRNIIGKNITEEELIENAKIAFRCGWRHIKLYFMIGLPHEDISDIEAIIDLARRIAHLRGKSPAQINLSISNFIPKPHTPFQWYPMERIEILLEKQEYLKKIARKYKYLKLNFHSVYMSIIEGLICRGNGKIGTLIDFVYSKKGGYDASSETFMWEVWEEALKKLQISIEKYVYSQLSPATELIWDFIDTGINREHLLKEYYQSFPDYFA